jgi:hypothetical protein
MRRVASPRFVAAGGDQLLEVFSSTLKGSLKPEAGERRQRGGRYTNHQADRLVVSDTTIVKSKAPVGLNFPRNLSPDSGQHTFEQAQPGQE